MVYFLMIGGPQGLLLYQARKKKLHRQLSSSISYLYNQVIEKAVNRYVSNAIGNTTKPVDPKPKTSKHYYKIPNIGRFFAVAQTKLRHLVNYYCTNLDIKLAFSTFNAGHFFQSERFRYSWPPVAGNFFLVLAVMPVTLAKLLASSTLASFSSLYRTRLLMSTNALLHLQLAENPVLFTIPNNWILVKD